eukprot:sb/3470411/
MSKGKGTRSSTATSSTPAPVAPVSNDILPGRFTEADWLGVVELEDGEELVGDLIEEMVAEPERTPLDSWGRGSVPCRLVKVKEVEIDIGEEGEAQEDEENLPDDTQKTEQQEEDQTLSIFDPLTEKPNITKLNKIRDSIKQYSISNDVVACLRSVEEPPALQNYLYQAGQRYSRAHSDDLLLHQTRQWHVFRKCVAHNVVVWRAI